MKKALGVIGLGVMGKSLSRNLAQKGFRLVLYNRHVLGSEENVAQTFKEAHVALEDALAFDDLTAFVNALETPRKIILMVNAGTAVDEVLDDLSSLLTSGDIVLDGGNSHYLNTQRKLRHLVIRACIFLVQVFQEEKKEH